MTKEQIAKYCKEHNITKVSEDELVNLFRLKFVLDTTNSKVYGRYLDDNGDIVVEVMNPVEPIEPTEVDFIKFLNRWEDLPHYQGYEKDIAPNWNKKWFDKFYEHKGRRYVK